MSETERLFNAKVGDILVWPNGTMRVVRKRSGILSWGPRKVWITFTIKHCSWTGRCYTLYNLGELLYMGVRHTGINVKFKTDLDERINRVIASGTKELTCCSVRGIA